jgi:hypothetical protein
MFEPIALTVLAFVCLCISLRFVERSVRALMEEFHGFY